MLVMRQVALLAATALVASLALVGTASAAPYFSDDFSGPSLDANLVDIEDLYFFSGGRIGTLATRSYIRTTEDDYLSIDFRADLVYSMGGSSSGATGVFFGIGAGTEDAGFFDEPEAAIYLVDHPNGFGFFPASDIVLRVNGPGSGAITDLTNIPFPDSTVFARITKVGDSITFAYDYAYDGSFDPDGSYTASLSAVAPFLASGPSYLLFGTGNSPSRFDSIEVVPEPGSLYMLAAGVAMLLLRRRR
jgi:hypothetical protein